MEFTAVRGQCLFHPSNPTAWRTERIIVLCSIFATGFYPFVKIIPHYPRWLSLLTFIYGIAVFLWFTPEDTLWLALVFGLGGACLIAAHGIFRKLGGKEIGRKTQFFGLIGLGALTGGGTTFTTVGLLFLKGAIHSHLFPDYPLAFLLAIVERLPAWTLAGALIGLAAALLSS